MSTKWILDWQAEVGDHLGHHHGVQMKAFNTRFYVRPPDAQRSLAGIHVVVTVQVGDQALGEVG